jgi:amino acid adenylation domain-containing protein
MLSGEGWDEENLTFGELDRRARLIASVIQARSARGSRVLLVLDPGLDYICSLFGCFYAGAVAVPVYPPSMMRLQQMLPRLQAIIENAEASLMLTSRNILGESVTSMWGMSGEQIVAVDELYDFAIHSWIPGDIAASDLCLLQYTSGSTGTPRGVALSHANVMCNLASIKQTWDFDGAVACHWLPPYHDMGLVGGILSPAYCGRRTILLTPQDFMQRPLRWLQAIDRYRGSSSGSPNFGFEVCIRKIDAKECAGLDLSCWKFAMAGAEPVRASTIERFTEKFAPFGFQRSTFTPAYGMAESTVAISAKRRGMDPRVIRVSTRGLTQLRLQQPESLADVSELVSCGDVVPNCEVRIADPKLGSELPIGEIGEIWVRGGAVARGYWNAPEATARTFDACLRSPLQQAGQAPEQECGFLRTGDLGCIENDELFVTGRIKELIIVAGRNYYPHDIEAIVQSSSEAFRADSGVAFSLQSTVEERLVVVQEVWRPRRFDLKQLILDIRSVLGEQLELSPYAIVLVPTGTLPKTSSGKLRRNDCRLVFEAGELSELLRWQVDQTTTGAGTPVEKLERLPPTTETERWMATLWQEILGVTDIARSDDFFALGGESMLVTQLLVQLRQRLGSEVPLSLLFENSSLASFSQAIDSKLDQGATTSSLENWLHSTQPSESGNYPLSIAQRSFWLLDQLGHTSAFLHVPMTIRLDGSVEDSRWLKALRKLLDRHAMLRAQIVDAAGQAVQIIQETIDNTQLQRAYQRLDLRGLSPETQQTTIDELRRQLTWQPFSLDRPPLMRMALVQLTDQESELLLVMHHAICDAQSLHILIHDLLEFYRNEDTIVDSSTTPRYVDFALWEQSEGAQAEWRSLTPYWQQKLLDAPSLIKLPLNSGPDGQFHSGNRDGIHAQVLSRRIPTHLWEAVERLAARHQLTPSMICLTAYEVLLSRYTSMHDYLVAIPSAGRDLEGLQSIVGCFLNTFIHRASVTETQTVSELLRSTRDRLLDDLAHSRLPLEQVLEVVPHQREPDRMPLAQVVFLYQPTFDFGATSQTEACHAAKEADILPIGAEECPLRIRQATPDYSVMTAYDLSFVLQPPGSTSTDGQAEVIFAFDRRKLATDLVERMMENYHSILSDLAADDSKLVGTITIPSGDERQRLLHRWNQETDCDNSQYRTVAQWFADKARCHPALPAVHDGQVQLNYEQLEQRSNQLARLLQEQGIGQESVVGLHLPRSADCLIAILGIWKAGGAYVPLDPKFPLTRLQTVVSESDARLVITHSTLVDSAQHFACAHMVIDKCQAHLAQLDSTGLDVPTTGADLAYIMFTSGSTGKPKGIAIEQHSVVNLLSAFLRRLPIGLSDTWLATTTLSFDISVLELFLPLIAGAQLRVTDYSVASEPEEVIKLLAECQASWFQGTPSTYRMLLASGWEPAKCNLLCGGEALDRDLVERLLINGVQLWNVYGPTETTVWSTVQPIQSSAELITIGQPIDNTQLYILDDQLRLVPMGVPGELCIGGAGVARGYVNRADLTAERFIRWNVEGDEYGRIYRTGDAVRRDADGSLIYMARSDRQIKHRGFRIELDEIEHTIRALPEVVNAAVTHENRASESRITAWIVLSKAASDRATAESLRESLGHSLPDYMLPNHVQFLSAIPTNAAGKTDYRALGNLELSADIREEQAGELPATPLESRLAAMWSEALYATSGEGSASNACSPMAKQARTLGRHDNFFSLGGHSLMAAQLFARLRNELQVEVPLRELYNRPTIAGLAEVIVAHQLSHMEMDESTDLLDMLDGMSDEEAAKYLEGLEATGDD